MPAPVAAAQFHFGCVFTVRDVEGLSPAWSDLARAVQVWISAKNGNTRDLANPRFYLSGEWRPRGVVSRVVWKKRSGAFFRLVKCTTNRPP